jgi:ABC-2 type transport system permease protein
MIDLVRAEIGRLWSRRMLRGLALLVLGGILFFAFVAFLQASDDPNSGLEGARREVAECERFRESPEGPKDEFQCPTVEQVRPSHDKRFNYTESMPDAVRNVSIFLFVLALLIGASFVGAEWGTGTMTTLLTWEPRRGRLLIAKWIAAVVGAAAVALGALIFLTFVFYPIGALRGITSGLDGRWWKDVIFTCLRGTGLAGIGATFGVAFATFTRNTAAAVGFGVAYFGIADQLLSFAYDRRFERWFFQRNFGEYLGIGVDNGGAAEFGEALRRVSVSSLRAGILMSIYALIVLTISWAAFRSRDVT